MLRGDAEIALDEAVLAAAEAGRLYREAALRSCSPAGPSLAAAALLREKIAEELAEAARRVGWLARAPDPDAQAARALADEIQVVVGGNALAPERERREADQRLVDKLTHLLAREPLPAPVRKTVSRLLGRLGEPGR